VSQVLNNIFVLFSVMVVLFLQLLATYTSNI